MTDHYAYPFDPTGGAASNAIVGEQQVLSPPNWTDFYFIIPDAAPFFRDGLVVTHQPSSQVLVEGVDYHLTHRFMDATLGTAKPVFGSITFLDKELTGAVSLNYQTVGGLWTLDEQEILDILSNTALNPRITTWEQVAGMPVAFPPIDHEWSLDDLVGMSEVEDAVEAIATAISDQDSVNDVHVNDLNNPHQVNKTQIGLGDVENYPPATQAQATAGTSSTAYMTPLRVKQAIDDSGATSAGAHITDLNNPHQVTKSQVGLGDVENYAIADGNEAVQGTSNGRYMTPLRVREAIDNRVGDSLNTHLSQTDNPHSVTANQVGLGNVENYGVASQAEAESGTSNTKYMTPLRTQQLVAVTAGDTVGVHAARTDNPHVVTKEQVGLDSIENYPVATQVEAEAGTASNRYMTPLRVTELVDVRVKGDLDNHIADLNNPHQVTKAHVGLSSVQNYGIASNSEALAGSSNLKYMTPLRVMEAINSMIGGSLDGHVNSTDNPHSVTKAQVGLSDVPNWGLATQLEAESGTVNNAFMTPLRVSEAITSLALGPLNNHTSDTTNPHQVTAAQVDAPTNAELTTALEGKLDVGGTANDSDRLEGMTFSQLLSAIDANTDYVSLTGASQTIDGGENTTLTILSDDAGESVLNLVGDDQGTGRVFVGQSTLIGGGIEYNGDGTPSSTGAGTDLVTFFRRSTGTDIPTAWFPSNSDVWHFKETPTVGDPPVPMALGTDVSDHTSLTNNPHSVTKSQVNLGNVENYGIASQAEAEAGTVNNAFMTPLRVAQAITEQASSAIGDHTNDFGNPHSVTKAQVGLSNVQNYGITTTGDAQTGTTNVGYMTPLRTKEAFDSHIQPVQGQIDTIVDDLTTLFDLHAGEL